MTLDIRAGGTWLAVSLWMVVRSKRHTGTLNNLRDHALEEATPGFAIRLAKQPHKLTPADLRHTAERVFLFISE